MVPSVNGNDDDWFKQLDAELEKKTQSIINDVAELNDQLGKLNRTLIDDFARINARFSKINVLLTMEPPQSAFAEPAAVPEEWKFKPDFDFASVKNIQIIDRTQDQGRMGDSLKVWYYNDEGVARIRVVFEYCEGEHYYKYAGWKRVFGQFIVYDEALSELNMDSLHGKIGAVVKAWYESHLRRNRDVLIGALKETFEKGETFTE